MPAAKSIKSGEKTRKLQTRMCGKVVTLEMVTTTDDTGDATRSVRGLPQWSGKLYPVFDGSRLVWFAARYCFRKDSIKCVADGGVAEFLSPDRPSELSVSRSQLRAVGDILRHYGHPDGVAVADEIAAVLALDKSELAALFADADPVGMADVDADDTNGEA